MFFLFLLVLCGCIYEPQTEYVKEISTDHLLEASLSLEDYDELDTIHIYGTTEFSYSILKVSSRVEEVAVFLDDGKVLTQEVPSGSFILSGSLIRTRTYKMTVQFIAKTGTGSLADKLNAEKLVVSRAWVLVVDVNPPPTPEITFSVENGFLTLRWPKFTKPSFKHYQVTKEESNFTRIYRITDPQHNFWVDSSFVGGAQSPRYRVQTDAFYSSFSRETYHGFNYDLNVSYNGDGTVTVNWEKSPYYNAFLELTLLENGKTHVVKTNPQDNTFTFSPAILFGEMSELSMQVSSRFPFTTRANVLRIQYSIGKKLNTGINNIFFNTSHGFVASHLEQYNALLVYYNNNLEPTDTFTLPRGDIYVPYTGDYVFFFESGEKLYNLATKQLVASRTSSGIHSNLGGSSTGWFCNSPRLNGAYFARLFDLTTNAEKYWAGGGDYMTILSDDGKYVRNSRDIVSQVNQQGQFVPIGTLRSDKEEWVKFRNDKSDELLLIRGNSLLVFSSNTLTLLRTIPLAVTPSFVRYDPGTGNLLLGRTNSTTLHFVNVVSGATKSIECSFSSYNTIKLVNGYLFLSNGYGLKVF